MYYVVSVGPATLHFHCEFLIRWWQQPALTCRNHKSTEEHWFGNWTKMYALFNVNVPTQFNCSPTLQRDWTDAIHRRDNACSNEARQLRFCCRAGAWVCSEIVIPCESESSTRTRSLGFHLFGWTSSSFRSGLLHWHPHNRTLLACSINPSWIQGLGTDSATPNKHIT